MKVLALCSYPLEAACTRYRLIQYVTPLAESGIELKILPFLGKDEFATLYKTGHGMRKALQLVGLAVRRLSDSLAARKFDAILIQREAMLFGPPVFEWLAKTIGKCPLILDLDDATYTRSTSTNNGRLVSAIRCFGKTDRLIDWSATVICGNQSIANYVGERGKPTIIVPTVVDTDRFHPVDKSESKTPVIGWIGTHSTFPFLEALFPVFSELARKYEFVLKIVGAGKEGISIEGVNVENATWQLESEIDDFQSLDIGLYPMHSTDLLTQEWILGKSGFKAIQYLAIGIPFVVTPIGVTKEIGIENITHFAASNHVEWYENLEKLVQDFGLRVKMGAAGREYALQNFTVAQHANTLSSALFSTMDDFRSTA